MILAAPLYLLAQIVPGIGLVQTVYLFNVLVGAAAGCVLFLYALALGYRERTAAAGGAGVWRRYGDFPLFANHFSASRWCC